MLDFFRVFFQKKSVSKIVEEKALLSKSLFWYVISIGVILVGTTIGTFFEQIIFFLLGWQDLFSALFSTGTYFVLFLVLAIPGIIALAALVLVYFFVAKLLGGNAFDFPQFLSGFLVIAGSVGFISGLVSVLPFVRHLINFLVVLYGVFLYIKFISRYFSVSFGKAFIIWFLPTAVLGAIVFVIALVVGGLAFLLQ